MIDKLIFTTCTAAYLAHAKSMADSVVSSNSSYQVCIGLIDRVSDSFSISSFSPHLIIEVEEINVPYLDEMASRYSLLELSCALKPWFAIFFLKKFSASSIIYLDTDIMVFSSFHFLENELNQNSILLTPHVLSPLQEDGKRPHATAVLKSGIYNAGFFAVKNDINGNAFLNWWKDILVHNCYEDGKKGLASDQSWLNLVPLFFNNVLIIRHPGCNVAYWNLYERKLEKKENVYIVNEKFPLIFFHFSGYNISQPEGISRHQDRFSLKDNFILKELFYQYKNTLEKNKLDLFKAIPCYYSKKKSLLQKLIFWE